MEIFTLKNNCENMSENMIFRKCELGYNLLFHIIEFITSLLFDV